MRTRCLVSLAVCGAMLVAAGCRSNSVDQSAFKSALNDYYRSKPECLWSAAVKFPAQADTSNDEQTKGFDALTDSGMLTRSSAEKKRFLIGSKQVNNYDISEKGRSVWTPDPSQYGVNYHFTVTNVRNWANSAEMKTAFPHFATDTSGQQTATATMAKSDQGWQVNSVQPSEAAANTATQ